VKPCSINHTIDVLMVFLNFITECKSLLTLYHKCTNSQFLSNQSMCL